MHIISLKMLRDFWRKHPDAEQPMRNWHTITEQARFGSFADVRRNFGSADYVAPFTGMALTLSPTHDRASRSFAEPGRARA